MRRAIVHIGMPRTGTTTLQKILTAHRAELARAGVLYPDLTPRSAEGVPHLSHQYLGETLDGRRSRHERAELLAKLDAALVEAAPDVAIISYEGLCLAPAAARAPQLLADLFDRRGYRVEILMTVKTQALYAQSQYTWRCQFLLEQCFFRDFLPGELRHRRYGYGAILRPWEPGAEKVHAVPVHDRESSAPLVERIFAQLGLSQLLGPTVAADTVHLVENRSLGPAAIEVARRLRERFRVPSDRALARSITDFVADAARQRGLDTEPFHAVDAATAAEVAARFSAVNEGFARHLWGRHWDERVAEPLGAAINEYGRVSADAEILSNLEEIAAAAHDRFKLEARSWFGLGRARRRLPRALRSI